MTDRDVPLSDPAPGQGYGGYPREGARAGGTAGGYGEPATEGGYGGRPVPPPPGAPEPAPSPSVADPAPLGLAAFAMTTFVLSLFNAGVYDEAILATLGLALFYGGLAQLLAGMWEFRRANVFGALAFTSFGAFWLSFWYGVEFAHIAAPAASAGLGAYLLGWCIFTAYMTVASLRVSGAVAAVFILLTITYALLVVGAFHSSLGWTHWGGYFGIATAVAAWYASFAGVVNSTFRSTVLPTFPLEGIGGARRGVVGAAPGGRL